MATIIRCDGCGKVLKKGRLRYEVTIQVRAAYDEMEVTLLDLVQNHRAEILSLLERLQDRDPRELEEGIYKDFHLDLCPACQRAYIRNPLRFHPEQGQPVEPLDVEDFLRSLRPPDEGGNT